MYLHGGPYSHIGKAWPSEIQYLVSCGFNVVACNYRGSTGYGEAYRRKLALTGCGTGEILDISNVIEWAVSTGAGIPGRIGALGSSYGGYLTWMCLAALPLNKLSAGVIINGMTDLAADFNSTRPEIRALMRELMGATPEQAPAKFRSASPIHWARSIEAPVLVIHGREDSNVDITQVDAMVEIVRSQGVSCEYRPVDGEGHGINAPADRIRVFERIVDFLERELGSQLAGRMKL